MPAAANSEASTIHVSLFLASRLIVSLMLVSTHFFKLAYTYTRAHDLPIGLAASQS